MGEKEKSGFIRTIVLLASRSKKDLRFRFLRYLRDKCLLCIDESWEKSTKIFQTAIDLTFALCLLGITFLE